MNQPGVWIVGVLLLCILWRLFSRPIKWIFKCLWNSALGLAFLLLFNACGSFVSISIGINLFTILFTALFGIPGIILMLLLQIVLL